MEQPNEQLHTENVQNQTPRPQSTDNIGPLIAIVIILLLIIVGGLYFWISQNEEPVMQPETTQEEDNSAELESSVDISELESIEADLADIEAEFNTTG